MGYGKAWEVPAYALNDLIANADKKGYCKIQVWHNSSDKPAECRLYLRLLLGWTDAHFSATRYYKPEKQKFTTKSNSTKPRRLKMGCGKAWKVPASKLQDLINNKDAAGNCKIEVWGTTSDNINNCDLYIGLATGWVDEFQEIPVENPT